jgi:hypothetical protein
MIPLDVRYFTNKQLDTNPLKNAPMSVPLPQMKKSVSCNRDVVFKRPMPPFLNSIENQKHTDKNALE